MGYKVHMRKVQTRFINEPSLEEFSSDIYVNRLKIMPSTNQVPCFSSADANII
jgi:hypothetical protein